MFLGVGRGLVPPGLFVRLPGLLPGLPAEAADAGDAPWPGEVDGGGNTAAFIGLLPFRNTKFGMRSESILISALRRFKDRPGGRGVEQRGGCAGPLLSACDPPPRRRPHRRED